MADNVQWIRFKVGTFDGTSFKRIKRAKIDGVVNMRDKLTAVWFELLDLGGKVNNNGFLINDEMAFISYEDIAIALDRTDEEVKLCMEWYIKNEMIDITDNLYLISNWNKYQNIDGLDKIRENNRLRQRRFKEKKKEILLEMKDSNVTVTLPLTLGNALPLKDNNISNSSLSQSISYFEDLDLNTAFIEFMKMRKTKIKNGDMTERAKTMMINKLLKYDTDTAIKMLEQSTINNWKDVYELKDDKPKSKQQIIDDMKNDQFNEIARERGYVK